jgi:hypothetical protein
MPFKMKYFLFLKNLVFLFIFTSNSSPAFPNHYSFFVCKVTKNGSSFIPFLKQLIEHRLWTCLGVSLTILHGVKAESNENNYQQFHTYSSYAQQCPIPVTQKKTNFINSNIKLLDSHTIAAESTFEGAKIGGISGLHYDEDEKILYAVTDETGTLKGGTIPNPHESSTIKPKFFRFKVKLLDTNGITHFRLIPFETIFLFEDRNTQVLDNTLDPESFSCRKVEGEEECLICSEPPTQAVAYKNILSLNKKGVIQTIYHTPSYFLTKANNEKIGLERNAGFEACSFLPDHKNEIVAINEMPLLQDRLCPVDFVRFTIF